MDEPLSQALDRARRVIERLERGRGVSDFELEQTREAFERALRTMQRQKRENRLALLFALISWIGIGFSGAQALGVV